MKKKLQKLFGFGSLLFLCLNSNAQITLLQDYKNTTSPTIGTFQGIRFREAGFSALYVIPGTNGKEFWTCSDRGVNIDAANANPASCRPTYDKIYSFPSYAPKIHRIKLNGDSIQILQTITMKRPSGTNASGIINPTGFGSTAAEVASTDTVMNCSNFNLKTVEKDVFGIDSEGLVVDKDGNFWICEEGGPTIWKLNSNGVVLKRFTPYANLIGAQSIDIQIDTVFKYRKNNRGFEGIAITPNGKIYAIIQSPILYPSKAVGEATRIHRILEINPNDNSTRMFAYLNDGIIGASGANQIRLRDWKIGDMAAINNNEFLVLEAAQRGINDFKKLYKIDISTASTVNSGLYGGKTLEALVDSVGLAANSIMPVKKVLVMDLLANGWPSNLDKAEGLAIINDSTIAIGNDNDYAQYSPTENGVAVATTNLSHVITYKLSGKNKLTNYISYHCANAGLTLEIGENKNVYVGYLPKSCATISATVLKGGTLPYNFMWNTGATTNLINVCPTTSTKYFLTVTDANGCSVKDSAWVFTTDVRCENNKKVEVCATVKINTKIISQKTYCVNTIAASILINTPSTITTWNIGSCDINNKQRLQFNSSAKYTNDDFGTINLTPQEYTLIYGDPVINLYPNPTNSSSSINIELNNVAGTIATVGITDILGKVIYKESISIENHTATKQLKFNENLSKGIYIVVITTNETITTEKLIVR